MGLAQSSICRFPLVLPLPCTLPAFEDILAYLVLSEVVGSSLGTSEISKVSGISLRSFTLVFIHLTLKARLSSFYL